MGIVTEKWFAPQAVVGFWPAQRGSGDATDDIVLPQHGKRLHGLRQQLRRRDNKPNLSIADFVAPADADVTDQTLTYLRSMANLRELDLNDSQVTDDGAAELAKLTALEVIRLRGTKITDAGLREHLSRLPVLKRLDLRATSVTDEAIEAWKTAGKGRRALR